MTAAFALCALLFVVGFLVLLWAVRDDWTQTPNRDTRYESNSRQEDGAPPDGD